MEQNNEGDMEMTQNKLWGKHSPLVMVTKNKDMFMEYGEMGRGEGKLM